MAVVRIGDLLKAKGLISERELRVSLVQQGITGDLLGDTLVKLGFVSSKEMGLILSEQSGIEFKDLSEYPIAEEALRMVPKDIAEKAGFIPLDLEEGRLSIGIITPSNIRAVDAVTRITGNQPKVYMVDTTSFYDAVERAYFFLENPIQKKIQTIVDEIKVSTAVTGANITSLAELFIMDGIRRNATDVHINPTADIANVFYRINGVLQYGHGFPKVTHGGITARIKILSQLDIAEQRLPQDGSFSFSLFSKKFDIRVSTVPTIYGENIVMRVLAGTGDLPRLERLGFTAQDTGRIKVLFQKPHGIILITGPTGSGKTTTLYAALREIDILERNVITVEDPVEYKLSFVKQTQVNEKAGYDFALAGRNFMRQDPDVMLLGEIRDEETAKIAVRSAITGHLVLSTLHTNDAVTAVPRLIDLKLDRFLVSSSLLAIVAQRLARKICKFCKKEYNLDDNERAIFEEHGITLTTAMKGTGCPKCEGTGYAGRLAIGEVLTIDDEIREMIYEGVFVTAIKDAAVKKGMTPMKEDGIKKAAAGLTTLREVLRVAG